MREILSETHQETAFLLNSKPQDTWEYKSHIFQKYNKTSTKIDLADLTTRKKHV